MNTNSLSRSILFILNILLIMVIAPENLNAQNGEKDKIDQSVGIAKKWVIGQTKAFKYMAQKDNGKYGKKTVEYHSDPMAEVFK